MKPCFFNTSNMTMRGPLINAPFNEQKSHVLKYHITLTIFLLSILTYAQDEQKALILEKNSIEIIEGNVFDKESILDSFLITREYYNKKGRRTKIEVYHRDGVGCVYSYTYLHDTIRTERITDCNGKISRTEIYYDKKNREIGATDFDESGSKNGTYYTTIYNDKKRTKDTKTYFNDKLAIYTKTKFDINGEPIMYSRKYKGKWKHTIADNGINPITYKAENYKSTGLNLVRKTDRIDENRTIIALNGRLNLVIDDILVTENYLNSQAL